MKVLFVCEGNMFRSQIAEKFYNTMTGTNDARSAGVNAALLPRASRRGEAVMQEIGMTLEGQYSKQLAPEMVEWADRIFLFSVEHVPLLLDNDTVENWNIEDLGFGKEGDTTELDRETMRSIRAKVKEFVTS